MPSHTKVNAKLYFQKNIAHNELKQMKQKTNTQKEMEEREIEKLTHEKHQCSMRLHTKAYRNGTEFISFVDRVSLQAINSLSYMLLFFLLLPFPSIHLIFSSCHPHTSIALRMLFILSC